ncbi:E3 ubiquitin ligase [Dissophora globulifera]|uniref:E3 ubiquitin ligase n=1 Tax=Dissophora globulifera TaxID=979702 RepID=A0A9P6UY75_9FUNG|nr:E3 ubiquitin ligase [Dissophora globulifera]
MAKGNKGNQERNNQDSLCQEQTFASASTPSTHISSTSGSTLDDMALQLLAAKETDAEVEQLRNQVRRLQKEIEYKDAMIERLQARSGVLSDPGSQNGSHGHSASTLCPSSEQDEMQHSRQQHQRDAALQCTICVEYFTSPFTVECGHTFCYTCLHSWLQIHKSCPTCRTKLLRRPTLSFSIREQVHASIARLPEAERKVAMEKLETEERNLKRIQSQGDLWQKLFRSLNVENAGGTIIDEDDGVRDVEDSADSQDDTDQDSEPDAYDSHDSFINDEEDSEAGSESEDEDNAGLSARLSGESSNDERRGTRRRVRAAESAITQLTRRRRQIHLMDSDDESTSDNAVDSENDGNDSVNTQSHHSLDNDDDDDSDAVVEITPPPLKNSRRKRARRAIMISDEDDDEDDNDGNLKDESDQDHSNDSENSDSDIDSDSDSDSDDKGSDENEQTIIQSAAANGKATKRLSSSSSEDVGADASSESSDDDFESRSRSHRSKKPRRAGLEALFT